MTFIDALIKLQGSTLRIEDETKVRPLANVNFKGSEDKVKVHFNSFIY